MAELTVGSLFSGIGGLDLGLERAGMRVIWNAEVDPYCCRVLKKHWPDVPNLGDVTAIDWSSVERPDVICGGYPCQPFSLAGGRAGEDDARHLWPYVSDAVRVLRPRYALLENVAGHLSLGFGRVLGDLAEIGYDAEWDCIPAAAIGAPHQRDRVFVVAYPEGQRCEWSMPGASPSFGALPQGLGPVADANSSPRDGSRSASEALPGLPPVERLGRRSSSTNRRAWPSEPDVGRVAYGVPSRVDRLRGLGNAVVPQVAEHVGRLILEAAR